MLVLSSPENLSGAREGAVPAAKHRHRALIPVKGSSIMPSSPRTVHVSTQRACPACGATRCSDPAQCLYFLTSRPWADCIKCAGSGWAGDDCDPLQIFCGCCDGSGLNEFGVGQVSPDEISDGAKERLAAYVARLAVLVAASPAPVALAA